MEENEGEGVKCLEEEMNQLTRANQNPNLRRGWIGKEDFLISMLGKQSVEVNGNFLPDKEQSIEKDYMGML